jgi:hypothetical protein
MTAGGTRRVRILAYKQMWEEIKTYVDDEWLSLKEREPERRWNDKRGRGT